MLIFKLKLYLFQHHEAPSLYTQVFMAVFAFMFVGKNLTVRK